MQINNVSFGAKLVLDKTTTAFTEQHNELEVAEFKKYIETLGKKSDTIEISNLAKHKVSELRTGAVSQYRDNEPLYIKPETTKYTADLKVNGVLNKVTINVNDSYPATLPLKQLAAIASMELYGTPWCTVLENSDEVNLYA